MRDVVYMKVSKDRFQLPEYIADSLQELSEMTGYKYGTIASQISKKSKVFIKVELEPEPDMYPDNDGNLWYRDHKTGRTILVEG